MDEQLIRVVAEASALFERLRGEYTTADDVAHEGGVQKRLGRWLACAANGDEEKWRQRLGFDGLDPERVGRALRPVRMSDPGNLPPWALLLKEVTKVAASADPCELKKRSPPPPKRSADESQAKHWLLFEEIALPFLEIGRRRLRRQAGGDALALLAEEACAGLEHGLLRRLSVLCWQTLYWEFSVFRSARRSSIFYRFGRPGGSPTTDLYAAFTRRLLSDGLAGFFQRYPVLARLAATCVLLWVESAAEFLSRLRDDLPRLRAAFPQIGDEAAGLLQSVRPGLSDPHNGGRTAIAVTFRSGLRLVYKPRNLDLEKAWFELLKWTNGQGLSLPLKVISVLDCGAYGWVEFVPQRPAEDHAAAGRYYQRVGMHLALVYVLSGTDFHQENIIACGEQPVLIDLEMLLSHRHKERGRAAGADLKARELLNNSVLRSGLLPQWTSDRHGDAIDVGGLGSMVDNLMPETPHLERAGSDAVHVVSRRAAARQGHNDLIVGGAAQSASDYAADIVAGFERMYTFLLHNRERIAAPDGPLRAFRGRRVRYVFRATRWYTQLMQYALQPCYLRDGAVHSIELDRLSRPFVADDTEAVRMMWPLVRHERDALERMDVPIFHAASDADGLRLGDEEVIEGCFRESSDELILSRLGDLGEDDCRRQVEMIRSTLYARAARHLAPLPAAATRDARVGETDPLRREEALAEATAIAESLRDRAITADDGSVTWLGLELIPDLERWRLQPLGSALYGGGCGVALFLAMFEQVSGDRRFHDLTLGALASPRMMLSDPEAGDRLGEDFPVGGGEGIGSYIYSLLRVGQMLGEDELLRDARRAAALLTPELIERDAYLDVLSGSAGAILGLLALHRAGVDKEALQRAIVCGRHLLGRRTESVAGPRAWKTMRDNDRLLAGFSHGAAGIAYALLRLFEATGDEQYRQAAAEAIEYEGTVFSAERGNWPDFRACDAEGRPGFVAAWCHGAPGIGLARLGALPSMDTPGVRRDIETAVAALLNLPPGGRDHLCCGAMGHSDLLLSFARGLGRTELELKARRRAAGVVRRARRQGYVLLEAADAADAFVPGLYQGLAGVGYVLLRLAAPDRVPSVLLWDQEKSYPTERRLHGRALLCATSAVKTDLNNLRSHNYNPGSHTRCRMEGYWRQRCPPYSALAVPLVSRPVSSESPGGGCCRPPNAPVPACPRATPHPSLRQSPPADWLAAFPQTDHPPTPAESNALARPHSSRTVGLPSRHLRFRLSNQPQGYRAAA